MQARLCDDHLSKCFYNFFIVLQFDFEGGEVSLRGRELKIKDEIPFGDLWRQDIC